MDREELLSFINNAILLGEVESGEILDNLEESEDGGNCCSSWQYRFYRNFFEELSFIRSQIEGSVCFDNMYFKVIDNKIILMLCTSEYESIDLYDVVDEIAPYAFAYNSYVKSITALSVKQIGKRAFFHSAIEKINFPNVIKISKEAFSSTIIKEVDFPNAEEIEEDVFYNCAYLKRFNAPKLKVLLNIFEHTSWEHLSAKSVASVAKHALYSRQAKEIDLGSATYIHPKALCDKSNNKIGLSGLCNSKVTYAMSVLRHTVMSVLLGGIVAIKRCVLPLCLLSYLLITLCTSTEIWMKLAAFISSIFFVVILASRVKEIANAVDVIYNTDAFGGERVSKPDGIEIISNPMLKVSCYWSKDASVDPPSHSKDEEHR